MKKAFAVLMFALLLCGCTNFEYAGQDFPERTSSQPVAIFESRAEIPLEKYRIIGHGTLFLPNDLDDFDIRAMMVKEARKHGADAFCFVSRRLVNTGIFSDSAEDLAAEASVQQDPVEIMPDGSRRKLEKFGGAESPLIGNPQHRQKLRIQLLFLLNDKDFEREIKLRDR